MKVRMGLAAAASAACLVLAGVPASAQPANVASGTLTRDGFPVTIRATPVGSATYAEFSEQGETTGTFAGTYLATDRCLEFPTGVADCVADITISTADGASTVSLFDVGTFRLVDPTNPLAGGQLQSAFTVVSGSGRFAGIRGAGTLDARLMTNGAYSGRYAGRVFLSR
jgi:hypothetical protein